MKKEKTINVYSTFKKLLLYNFPALDNISKEILLDIYGEPVKIKEEVIHNLLLKSPIPRHIIDFNLLAKRFIENDIFGVITKNKRIVTIVYKIGNLFFLKTGSLESLIESRLLHDRLYVGNFFITLNSFSVLQAHDNDLSNTALKKFLSAVYGLNTEKLYLHNVQRIYSFQTSYRDAVIIFDNTDYDSKYYECKIVTKNNILVFPVASLPRYEYRFKLITYLQEKENLPDKDNTFHKYIVENREDFIYHVDKILRDEINAEEFLMGLYV